MKTPSVVIMQSPSALVMPLRAQHTLTVSLDAVVHTIPFLVLLCLIAFSSLACNALQAQHALTVSLNKLGDLRYMQGDLPAAREQYLQALDIRRTACDGGDGGGSAAQQVWSWIAQGSPSCL